MFSHTDDGRTRVVTQRVQLNLNIKVRNFNNIPDMPISALWIYYVHRKTPYYCVRMFPIRSRGELWHYGRTTWGAHAHTRPVKATLLPYWVHKFSLSCIFIFHNQTRRKKKRLKTVAYKPKWALCQESFSVLGYWFAWFIYFSTDPQSKSVWELRTNENTTLICFDIFVCYSVKM